MTRFEIIDARRTLGMSRRDLAAAILCGYSTLKDWENGYRPISAWFAGEIRALLRRHERDLAASSVPASPFLPIPAWRLAQLRGEPEAAPAPDTFVSDPWRDGLATELPYTKQW